MGLQPLGGKGDLFKNRNGQFPGTSKHFPADTILDLATRFPGGEHIRFREFFSLIYNSDEMNRESRVLFFNFFFFLPAYRSIL